MRPQAPVLIVDDDEGVREAMTVVLETSGFQAVGAADGQEAIDMLHAGMRPCLIVLDLMMPRVDGETFRRLQLSDARLADIPVLVFSARSDSERIARALGAPSLRKPFDVDDALEAVERHCLPD
jgi:CheY-like chemotaxis protein